MDAKLEFKYISYTELDIEENYRRVPVILTDDKKLIPGRTNNGSTYKAISGIRFQKTGISKENTFNTASLQINGHVKRELKSKLHQRNEAFNIGSDIHSFPQCATVPRMFKLDLSKLSDSQCLDKIKQGEPDPVKTLNLSPRFPSKIFVNKVKTVEMERKRPVPSPFRYRAALPSDRGNKLKRTSSLSPNFHRKVFQNAGAVKPLHTPISLPVLRDITSNSPLRNIMTNPFRMFPVVKQLKSKSHTDNFWTETGIKSITVEDALSALDDQCFSSINDIPCKSAKNSEQLPIKPARKKFPQFSFDKNSLINGCRSEFNDSNRNAYKSSPRQPKKRCNLGEENIQPKLNTNKAKSEHCSRNRPLQFDNWSSHKRLMQKISPPHGDNNLAPHGDNNLSAAELKNVEENKICPPEKLAQQMRKIAAEKTEILVDMSYPTQCRMQNVAGVSRDIKVVGNSGEIRSCDQCKRQSIFDAEPEYPDHNWHLCESAINTNFQRDYIGNNNECRSSELACAIRQRKLSSSSSFKDKIRRFFVGRKNNSSDEVISTLRDVNRKVAFHGTDALPIATPPPRTVVLFKELKTKENELGTGASCKHESSSQNRTKKENDVSWEPYLCVLQDEEQPLMTCSNEDGAESPVLLPEFPRACLEGESKSPRGCPNMRGNKIHQKKVERR